MDQHACIALPLSSVTKGVCAILLRLYMYFYGASKNSLHKPKATFGNALLQISLGFNYYLHFVLLQFLSKSHQNFFNSLVIKKALFIKSLLYQSMIVKIIRLQKKL
jgi:hypothetical protein